MSFATKLKTGNIKELAPVAFYSVVGIIFLILLPFAHFPPHIGLTGILYLITAYSILKKRPWTMWLVFALFAVGTTLALYTVYVIALSNWIVSLSLMAYAVLTWAFTASILSKRKIAE